MKKLLCLLLAIVMVFSMAACGGSGSSGDAGSSGSSGDAGSSADAGEPIELTFWGHQENAINESFKAIAEDFHEEHPNITINFEFFPYDEFEAKVQTSLADKKAGADIYELWGGWGVDFCSTGALAQIPDEMAAEITEDAYAPTYGALEYEGHLYGMPMEFNIESGGMLVNKHLLGDKPIPTTWDELVATAKELTQGEGDTMTVKGLDVVGWDTIPYTLCAMILSQGDNYLNEDGTFNFTSEAAKNAFTELTDLVVTDGVTNLTGLAGGDAMENYQLVFADQCVFAPRGPWTIAEGKTTFELTYGEDFTYAALPWYGDSIGFAAETGWSLAVNGSSDKQEAAFQFLEYFFSDEVLMKHDVAAGFIPPKKSVAEDPALLESMPFLEPLVGILGNAQFIGYFNTDIFKETINNVYTDYCTGGIYESIDAALADLEAQCNANLT